MKRKILILILLAAFSVKAQVIFHYDKGYKELLTKNFVFVLNDVPENKELKDVIAKYWKLTKYKIIPENEIDNNLATDNVFFQVMDIREKYKDFKTKMTVIHDFTEFAMWSPTEKGLGNGGTEKDLGYTHRQFYVKIKLQLIYKNQYYNWAPGYLKNYLQHIQEYIKTQTEKGKAEDVADPAQIKELKNATLFVPVYTFDGKEIGDIFKKYKYKYEAIKGSELNKKILSGEKIYYMLTYTDQNHAKIIDIYNAETGQVIYHYFDTRPLYPYLRKDDISSIEEEVEKAK
ncbi:MAG TPA: hypothetical protein VNY73_05460 [Bacteroidia bacterium]|jgi:hypothetical protein|nr:hypothetical protein [Bacteroidia bacterium]